MKIKVFAHHKDCFRWRTLIQVGDDWTIRGTVFMKNPGSSRPLSSDLSDAELSSLNGIDNTDAWYAFSVDATMKAIINLFCKRAEVNGNEFQGVIQIFNIMNVMSPDLNHAIEIYRGTDNPLKCTYADDIQHIVSPVYVGWGDFYKHPLVQEAGSSILSAIQEKVDTKYLAEAGFIHPLYLMVYGGKKPKSIKVKETFYAQ